MTPAAADNTRPALTRSLRRWVGIGATAGALVVLALRLALEATSFAPNAPPPSMAWSALDVLVLMLCPAPLLLWPPEGSAQLDLLSWRDFAIATLANATLWGLLAALVCIGLARSKTLLVAAALLLWAIWLAVWPT